LGRKSYPKDDVRDVIHPVTPQFTLRWLAIAGARLGLSKIRPIGRGRVDDGEALVGRDRLNDKATCNGET